MSQINKVIKNIAFIFAVTGSSLILVYAVSAAWNEPAGIPPAGNVDMPLNVGIDLQAKRGPLVINQDDSATPGLTVMHDAVFLNGNVGIGTATPASKLEVVGDAAQNGAENVSSAANSVTINTTNGAFSNLVRGSQIMVNRGLYIDTRIITEDPVGPFNQAKVDMPVDWSAGYVFTYIKNPKGITTSGLLTATGRVSFDGAFEGSGGVYINNMDIAVGGGNDGMFAFKHVDKPSGPGVKNVIIFQNQSLLSGSETMTIDTEKKWVSINKALQLKPQLSAPFVCDADHTGFLYYNWVGSGALCLCNGTSFGKVFDFDPTDAALPLEVCN